jgi:hypothetical protein
MYSEELQEQTREFFKEMPMGLMKNYDGRFGVCILKDEKYIITDRDTRDIYTYLSIEEFIQDKWVID